MPNKIITLPKQLANQIAAGEVVERPVSVVKELVENSIDAGATFVRVRIENGGIDLIEIRDNGLGIPAEELRSALEKYSTSKITSLDDLYKVMTFGFRWEALASISSVSEFSICSKTCTCPTGKSICTSWWEDFTESDIAHNVGTTVLVEKLFFNTPARLAYLKKPRTEYLKIQEFIQKMALAYPEIWFSLEHNDKNTLSFPQNQGLQSRIYDIYGDTFSDNMIEVSHEFSGVQISWYITDPKVSFQNKTRQALFVNKRVISSPMIFKAVSDAYNRFIAHGSYPWYVLFIDVDPTQVDVNVHPRKMEVRFAGEAAIFRSVFHGIKDQLERVSLVNKPHLNSPQEKIVWGVDWGTRNTESAQYYTGSGTKFKNYSPYKNTDSNPAQSGIDFNKEVMKGWWKQSSPSSDLPQIGDLHDTPLGRIIGQIHNSYILLQTSQWVQILDQHALAERVIYEKLSSKAYSPKVQQLLWDIGLHLTSSEQEVLSTYSQYFTDMGFEIDVLSQGNIIIQAVPDFMAKQNIEKVFQNILSDISGVWSMWFEEVRHKIWAYAACRSAVKFGDPLTIFEMNKLLTDASLDYSATCPHGRPVVYDIWLEELQKKYER